MSYFKKLWHDVEPIFRHGLVSASVAVIAAGLLKLCDLLLPPDVATELHFIDHILVITLFCLFSGHTLLILLIRLGAHLRAEIKTLNAKQHRAKQAKVDRKEPVLLEEGQDYVKEGFKQSIPRKEVTLPRENIE
jgi:hypothetical protein